MRLRKVTIIVLGTAVLMAGLGYGTWKYMGKKNTQAGGGMPVETYNVLAQELVENLQAVGTLEASESLIIKTEVPGKVATISFEEGQPVHKDEKLVTIDDRVYASEVARTKASAELMRLTFERQSALQKSGATSQQLIDEAEAGVRQSEASYEAAKVALEKTQIKAPFDGIVGLRTIAIGDYLQVGDAITTLVAIDHMKVQFTLPEKYFSSLKIDTPLFLTVDAWPGKIFEGRLYAIDPTIDPETRNVRVKALLDNADATLRPGMFGYVRLPLHTRQNALLVPEEALIPKGNQMEIMTVVDGKAKSTPVTVGLRQKGQAEITEGLHAGDVIITAGHMKVQDGMPVQSMPKASMPAGTP